MRPKIGLVGTGQTVGIAHFHALGILDDGRADIGAVYDLNKEGAQTFLKEHGIENAVVCDSYEELLGRVDAVDICTPNFTHLQYVLGAIEADKAVFVEKPLSLSGKESQKAVDALNGKDLFNMVGFVYRYVNGIQKLRELIQNEIGAVYTYSASFGGMRLANPQNPVEWRMIRRLSGAGALGDFGSHLIDNASFLANLKFTSVQCISATNIPERPANRDGVTSVENDDQSVFIAKTAKNVLGSFTVSRIGLDGINILVAGEGGLARISLNTPEKIWYKPAVHGVYQDEEKEIEVPYQTPFDGWFVSEMKAFVDGLLGSTDTVPDIEQGHYVEAVIDAAEIASQQSEILVEGV